MSYEELERFRDEIRLWTLKELHHLGFGHYGGSLSIVEVLAVLYGKEMNLSSTDTDRDRFVLSKGHGGPALYATLALKGYFSKEMLFTLNQNGTKLPSHPDRHLTPGVEMTTGSLGQGISVAAGIALSHKLSGNKAYTYCIVGDGELNEGQCWEAIQFSAHHKLNRFFVFVDDNKKQLDGLTKNICDPLDFVEKFQSFGFASKRVNGANMKEIAEAIRIGKQQDVKPVAIILDTTKGQGIPYLEKKQDNHHVRPSAEDIKAIEAAISELEEKVGVNS